MASTLSIHSIFGYNYLVLANKMLNESEITTIGNLDYDPKWDSVGGDPFVILANFDENLQSSRKADLGEVLTRWSIYRRKKDDDELIFVGTIDDSEFTITDPLAGNNKEYAYYVFPETENLIGTAMVTDMVKNCSGWSYTIANLIERYDGVYVSNEIWNLSLNVEAGEVTQNLDVTSFQTIGQFDKISRGKKNYLTASISCVLGDLHPQTGLYEMTSEKLNAWRNFISSSDKYIWKDRLGDVRIVSIADNPTSSVMNETSEQAQQISLSVKEVMSIDDIKHGVIGNYTETVDKSYTHIQKVSSENWYIVHALNKFPKVSVTDASGKSVYAQITYVDKNTVQIKFSHAVSGSAYFN